ncbi:uncharacterized protein [Argopecten irradians]|uniref:uncharacterized protein isoform X1 n=1 Tax=Argopecten irradians TaxID=31199 RepID=UPI003720F40D
MTYLTKRKTCFRRIWKQSNDVLFQARKSAASLQRFVSPMNVCMSMDHPQEKPEKVPNHSVKETMFLMCQAGVDVLTKLFQLVKISSTENCVKFHVSQPICQMSDCQLQYVERIKGSNSVMDKEFSDSLCFLRQAVSPEISVKSYIRPVSEIALSFSRQNLPIYGHLKKQPQFLFSNISKHDGREIKMNRSLFLHQVRQYSVDKTDYSPISDNMKGRLLSVPYHTHSSHHLFSALTSYRNSSQMRPSQVLVVKPLVTTSLKRQWISKKHYEFPELKEEDLEESFMRGGGAGGQAVAKTNNCVLLLHKPTGLQVKMHVSRSLEVNRKLAREKMVEKLDFLYNGENSYNEQKKAEKSKAKKKMKKKSELVREKMKAFKEGLEKMEDGHEDD